MMKAVELGFTEADIVAGGIRTRYATAGSPARGRAAVLLIHGRSQGASGATEWHGLLPRLARAGLQAYAPDQLSMGWTDASPHAWPVDGYESLITHMLAFLDAMALDRVHVIGNSMGAYIAARLALDHPERVRSAVLIGSNTLAAAVGLVPIPMPALLTDADWQAQAIHTQLLKQFANPKALPDWMLQARIKAALRTGVRAATDAFVQALRDRATDPQARARFFISDAIQASPVPLRLLWGERDRVGPASLGQAFSALLPEPASYVCIPEAGHACHIEAAERVAAEILPFLFSNASARSADLS